ncbi:ABC transporter substrate-binding protein [Aliterella atlantica]|uniref:Peptide ABC transporter substrate-binding protein n=1 Tax=Aliterella atlantica CENA595 TaxID=1618023 RepID=A0A0D8ZMU4_9CYAN|nr:ABC transporter substrate-binding protein [Aliterella atlantica]KJH70158.1 peptide ABC transporter substrate-binding protein [Aliterella atlantica CENA595]
MTFHNRGRKWIAFILTFLVAIAFSACNPNNFKSQAAQTSQLVVSVVSDPQTFNYALSQQLPNVFGLTFKGLTTINGKGEIEPELAESWTISADKKRIEFTLRPGLKWSDGKPLTADDVVFTYNDIAFNKEISTDIRDYLKIGVSGALPQVQKMSDRQVAFILPEPFSPFFSTTTGDSTSAIAILPKHALEASVKAKDADGNPRFMSTWGTDTDPKKIITNGPYTIESYSPSQRLVFRRNPYYWRKDKQGNSQPYIEKFIWQIVESTDTSLLQFRSGGLDIVGASPTNFSLLKKEEKRGKFTLYNGGPAYGQSFITFNLNKGRRNGKPLVDPIKSRWFNTVEFRQAVSYAIDRQTIINNIFRGLGEPQNSPIDVQSKYYLAPEDGLKVYDYNPEKAKQLLLKAGFKYNAKNQLLDADNNRVRFTLLTNSGGRTGEVMGAQIKQNLAKIGIQVDLNAIAFTVLGEKLHNTLDWECYFGGLIGSGVDPNDGANVWLTEGGLHSFNQGAQPGQAPIEGRVVSDWEQEIANLYIKGAQEFDEAKRKAIYDETQRITQEYLPYIYLVNPLSMAAIRDRIHNVKFSALGAFWNIYELKVDQ